MNSNFNFNNKIVGKGLTYDDILILPAYSEVLPREVCLKTKLTKNISINIPIISAAMDTVTDHKLAIAIAREGGVGIIHKNMSIKRQAESVRKVKRSESGMITDPITLNPDASVGEALRIMKENKIGGIPIVDKHNKLIGIVTNRDLFFEKNLNKAITNVMTKENLITANIDTTLEQAEIILQKHKVEKLPIINEKGILKGLITVKDIKKIQNHPNACKDKKGRLIAGAAVGVAIDTMNRVEELVNVDVDIIVIDSAHGHSKGILEIIKKIKQSFPNLEIIAGNVATGQAAKDLVKAGADGVKVGIGPGSICTTRIIAGVGVPQLSAIMEVTNALKGSGIPIVGDGGIKHTGDIVKAIAAGADTIMAGSLFAGVEEAPGETVIYEGRKFKTYRGMGSVEAMKEGSGDRYFQDPEEEIKKLVPEGIVGRVPYKGTLSEVVFQYIGGLKAGMGYAGAKDINELKKAKFVEISASGIRENHPHDVIITKEAPNYTR